MRTIGKSYIMSLLEPLNMDSVAKLETAVRGVFLDSRVHKKHIENTGIFNQIISSLDAIGDTEYAFDDFNKLTMQFDEGVLYLLTYGILQAIFLQQDAIMNLGESLGVKVELPVELRKIRDLRNDAIGHPTQRNIDRRKKIYSFHHISRSSLSLHGFNMLSTYSNSDSFHHKHVDLREIIETQHTCSLSIMAEIYEFIREEENKYREKHMGDKLRESFHDSYHYLFENVRECVRNVSDREFCLSNFISLTEMVHKFKKKLADRREEDSIEYIQGEIEYPISELKLFLEGKNNINQRTAEIFVFHIEHKFEDLITIAKEIDEKYETSI